MAQNPMQVTNRDGEVHIRMTIKSSSIEYDFSAKGFRILGHKWNSNLAYDEDRPIYY